MSNHWMVGNLLRKSTRKEGEPLGIIYYPAYSKLDKLVFDTSHNFYIFNCFKRPEIHNNVILMSDCGRMPDPNYDYDLVVSFFNDGLENARLLAQFIQLPLLCIIDSPPPSMATMRLQSILQECGNKKVVISNKIQKMWPGSMDAVDLSNKDQISKLLVESANIIC